MAALSGLDDIGQPETSEDDSISLTSTKDDGNDGDVDYEVEKILADRRTHGVEEYLVKWKGYGEESNTWEPKKHFNQRGVFGDWRIARELEKPFDIRAWEERVSKIQEEKSSRAEDHRRRRQRKREKLNLQIDPKPLSMSQSTVEDSSRRQIWTKEEQDTLIKALQDVKRLDVILERHGRRGSMSQILKAKTFTDLELKVSELRKEFEHAGKDPPDYLQLQLTYSKAKTPIISKKKERTPSMADSDDMGDPSWTIHSDSGASTDSDVEGLSSEADATLEKPSWKGRTRLRTDSPLVQKKISRINTNGPKAELPRATAKIKPTPDGPLKNKQHEMFMEQVSPDQAPKSSSGGNKMNRSVTTGIKSSVREDASREKPQGKPPGAKAPARTQSLSKETSTPSKVSRDTEERSQKPQRSVFSSAIIQNPFSGTARPPHESPDQVFQSILGKRKPHEKEASPPPTSRNVIDDSKLERKPSKTDPNPKKRASVGGIGIDVVKKISKPRPPRALPSKNVTSTAGTAPKQFPNLSIQSKVQKSRRNEPAPDDRRVMLLDPKTGKPPLKDPPAQPAKTALEKYAEDLCAKEAKEAQADRLRKQEDQQRESAPVVDPTLEENVVEQLAPGLKDAPVAQEVLNPPQVDVEMSDVNAREEQAEQIGEQAVQERERVPTVEPALEERDAEQQAGRPEDNSVTHDAADPSQESENISTTEPALKEIGSENALVIQDAIDRINLALKESSVEQTNREFEDPSKIHNALDPPQEPECVPAIDPASQEKAVQPQARALEPVTHNIPDPPHEHENFPSVNPASEKVIAEQPAREPEDTPVVHNAPAPPQDDVVMDDVLGNADEANDVNMNEADAGAAAVSSAIQPRRSSPEKPDRPPDPQPESGSNDLDAQKHPQGEPSTATADLLNSAISDVPPDAPRGPRLQTDKYRPTSMRWTAENYNPSKRFRKPDGSSSSPAWDASGNIAGFTFKGSPSREQRRLLGQLYSKSNVLGQLALGNNQEDIDVKFLCPDRDIRDLLLSIKTLPDNARFRFQHVCLASEYRAYFLASPFDYISSGSVSHYPHDDSEAALQDLADRLAADFQGALLFASEFTMLLFPAGASVWSFLDEILPSGHNHDGAVLRYAIQKPLPENITQGSRSILRLANNNPERYAEIESQIRGNPTLDDEKNIKLVFRDLFEIDYNRLITPNGIQKQLPANNFFLCFVPEGCEVYEPDARKRAALRRTTSEEHDFFVSFLGANGAEIYSVQDLGSSEVVNNGAWDYFISNIKSGTIIFHDSCIRIDLFPGLARLLRIGTIIVWKVSLSPMHPAERHPHLVRLFPHGGVILLSESFILYNPHEALRFVMWFRRVHLRGKTPGHWKVATRPRIREWLLDILDIYEDTQKDIFGHGKQIFANIYTEIFGLFETNDPKDGLMCHLWDYETPTDEAPIVSPSSLRIVQELKEWKGDNLQTVADHDNIRQNDDDLVRWFAEWATVNLHNFRRFDVILGYPKGHNFGDKAIAEYEKAYGHIEVLPPEKAFTMYSVTEQSKLDAMEVERRENFLRESAGSKGAAA